VRLTCPLCGERDLREFAYRGAAVLLDRPVADAGPDAFHAYVHLRDNPAGPHRELWHHDGGCRAWIVAERDTTTHAVIATALARANPP
jgi:heterotetrameric sarcosine oxidase delta subunit